MASTQLTNNDMASTKNRSRAYSPAVSLDNPTGRKVIMAIKVAPIKGHAVFSAVRNNAFFGGRPFPLSTSIPSRTTTALSTSIPIATMNAPNDMRCNVPPVISNTGKVINTVKISPAPIISPPLMPIVRISTSTTMTTDITRFQLKEPIAFDTLSGWKYIFSYSNPAGNRSWSSVIRASTSLPTSVTTTPGSIETQRAIAG